MSNKSKVKKRRDRNTLTFYEKIAVIRHHEANQLSRNNLARMFQCCTTQIRKIIDHKDEILAQWKEMCETNAPAVLEEMSKKRREFEMKAIAFILHKWVERCRDLQLNMMINDATLKMIATKMATVLNITDFKPTGRWIERFRLKFKYKDSNLSNPRSSDDPQGSLSVEDVIIEFKDFLPSFMRQEISNITSGNIAEFATAEQNDYKSGESRDVNLEDSLDPDDIESSTAAENVLQNLLVIQQFFKMHADYAALDVAANLQTHIEQTYILPSPAASVMPSPVSSVQQTDPEDDEYLILID